MITAGANRKTSVLAPALLSNPPRKPLIRNWLAKRPRWHIHLTPTSSSWLDQVERSFALIMDKIGRGIYRACRSGR